MINTITQTCTLEYAHRQIRHNVKSKSNSLLIYLHKHTKSNTDTHKVMLHRDKIYMTFKLLFFCLRR